MDWTIVVSVLVALLLVPVVLAVVGALVFLTAATFFRGHMRTFSGHVARCKQMCSAMRPAAADAAACGGQGSCSGAAT